MPIDRPSAIARREFMWGAGATLLAACGVMRQVHNTEILSSAPRTAALRTVLGALITSVLPLEHPQFPKLQAAELEATLLELFPIDRDPELATVRSAVMLFDDCAAFPEPPAPFLRDQRENDRSADPAVAAQRAVAHDRAAFERYARAHGGEHFAQQSLAARRAYLELWGQSALATRRRMYRGFRAWVLISAYSRRELWQVIGYDGPLLERG